MENDCLKWTGDYGPSFSCDGVNSIPISCVCHDDNSFSVSHERLSTLIDYLKVFLNIYTQNLLFFSGNVIFDEFSIKRYILFILAFYSFFKNQTLT